MNDSERIVRDFNLRADDEKKAFLEQTWCDHCQQENLGMINPIEYELNDIVFIEGQCAQCDTKIVTELTEDEF